jgi:hypothetical protein
MTESIVTIIYNFCRSYLTFILVAILFVINFYLLIINLNETNEENKRLHDYFYETLQIQYIPLIFITFIVIPALFYLMYILLTKKEKTTITEILFLISIITGFYKLAKSIIIIFNNYDKAKIATYGKDIEIPSKVSIIYKSLINDIEYSNIDILYQIWYGPIVSVIVITVFNIIITYLLNNKDSKQSFILEYLFKRENISISNLTIEDMIMLFETLSVHFNSVKELVNYEYDETYNIP